MKWSTSRLGGLCTKIGSGATPRGGNSTYKSSGISLIRSQNVYNDGFHQDGLAFIDNVQADALSNVELQLNDVLLNITGDSVARSCQVPEGILPARVNQHVAIIRPEASKVHHRFLRYVLIEPAMQNWLLSLAGIGATRNALTKGMIEDLSIPLPPLPVQRAIADILGSLDDKIEVNRKMNETLEAMARTTFRSWFIDFDPVHAKSKGRQPDGMNAETAKLFPSSFQDTEMGKIPKGWTVKQVSEVADINTWTLGKNDDLNPIEYVEISEVNRGDIGNIQIFERGQEPSRARRRLRHGDTVMSTVRPDRRSYFLCLQPSPHLIASTGFALLSPMKVPWSFLHAGLTQGEVFEYLGQHADGGAYPAVRPEIIGQLNMAIPDNDAVLGAFHEVCAGLFEIADGNRRQTGVLSQVRDSLLPRLLTGELSVPTSRGA